MENSTGSSEVNEPQTDREDDINEPTLDELEHLLVEEIGMWKLLNLGHPYSVISPSLHDTAAGVQALCELLGEMGIIDGVIFRKRMIQVQIKTLAEIRRDIIANKPTGKLIKPDGSLN